MTASESVLCVFWQKPEYNLWVFLTSAKKDGVNNWPNGIFWKLKLLCCPRLTSWKRQKMKLLWESRTWGETISRIPINFLLTKWTYGCLTPKILSKSPIVDNNAGHQSCRVNIVEIFMIFVHLHPQNFTGECEWLPRNVWKGLCTW